MKLEEPVRKLHEKNTIQSDEVEMLKEDALHYKYEQAMIEVTIEEKEEETKKSNKNRRNMLSLQKTQNNSG